MAPFSYDARVSVIHKRFALAGGRWLGYSEYGDPHGKPVLYFHGFPGSRIEARLGNDAAKRQGLRFVAADRPGYGLSDFQRGRAILDWPNDVLELAGRLGFERFAVIGVSGGAPYAAACARSIPERLSTVALVCPLGPPEAIWRARSMKVHNRLGLSFSRRFPALIRALFCLGAPIVLSRPEAFLEHLGRSSGGADAEALREGPLRETMADSFREAMRRGPRGAAWDITLYSKPWGFSLAEVGRPVFLWHGEQDVIVPPSIGRYVAEKLPHCEVTFCPKEGHFSLVGNYMDIVLKAVADA